MELGYRTGSFFILLGSVLILMFVIADMAKIIDVRLLIGGAMLIAMGIFIRRRYAISERPRSERFRVLRKMFRGKEKK